MNKIYNIISDINIFLTNLLINKKLNYMKKDKAYK